MFLSFTVSKECKVVHLAKIKEKPLLCGLEIFGVSEGMPFRQVSLLFYATATGNMKIGTFSKLGCMVGSPNFRC